MRCLKCEQEVKPTEHEGDQDLGMSFGKNGKMVFNLMYECPDCNNTWEFPHENNPDAT